MCVKVSSSSSFCVFFLWDLILFRLVFQDIEWTHIEYFNNAIICDLIENVSTGYNVLKNFLMCDSLLQIISLLLVSSFSILAPLFRDL